MPACNVPRRTIFTGDNLDILRGINSGCVDLIYLDPPFNSNRTYAAPLDSAARGAEFDDVWTLSDMKQEWVEEIELRRPALFHLINSAKLAHGESMGGYLTFMSIRLIEQCCFRNCWGFAKCRVGRPTVAGLLQYIAQHRHKVSRPGGAFQPPGQLVAGFNPSEPSLQPVSSIEYSGFSLIQGHLSPAFR